MKFSKKIKSEKEKLELAKYNNEEIEKMAIFVSKRFKSILTAVVKTKLFGKYWARINTTVISEEEADEILKVIAESLNLFGSYLCERLDVSEEDFKVFLKENKNNE